MTAYTISAIGWTTSILAVLWLLVRLIDRIDRWGSRNGYVIVVPESRDADVIDLNTRRAS